MANKVTPERVRAGAKLRELVEQRFPTQTAAGEEIGATTGGKAAVQTLRRWMSGKDFGDKQRRQAARVLGVADDYFGLESSPAKASAAPSVRLRWQCAQRWLASHSDATARQRETIAHLDAALWSEVTDDAFSVLADIALGSEATERAAKMRRQR